MKNILCAIACASISISSFALTCPPQDLVKQAKLIKAFQHPYDPDCWNFITETFTHDGIKWNVVFGTFIENANNNNDALLRGQTYYATAKIYNPNPEPVSLPKYILCDYTSTGQPHWIAALSPPSDDAQ